MRKSADEAAQTRRTIVETAARTFREHGVVASGLNELMAAAGLTRGGFYKHFESKDQLVAEACARAFDELFAMLERDPTTEGAVTAYLSKRHRDAPAMGCPLAGVGAELARMDENVREVATFGFERLVALLQAGATSKEERRRALVKASTMIGALTMARVVNDAKLSAEIVDEAKRALLAER